MTGNESRALDREIRSLMTSPRLSNWAQASAAVANVIELRSAAAKAPLVASLDGRSGSGKSTLARLVAQKTDAVMLPVDDFCSADVSDAEWERMGVEDRWAKVFDWAKLRSEAVVPLLCGRPARWHPIDFDGGPDSQGRYRVKTEAKSAEPAPVIVLDGV